MKRPTSILLLCAMAALPGPPAPCAPAVTRSSHGSPQRSASRTAAESGGSPRKRGMQPEDTYALSLITALEVAPDGASLVYTLETPDRDEDAFVHALYLMPVGGGEPKRVSEASLDASAPRFSPDGESLAFLADGGEGTQIFVSKTGSRRAREVTSGDEDVEEFEWSPDGKSFVFVRRDPPRRSDGGEPKRPSSPRKPGEKSRADEARDPIVITRTQIQRDGEGFLDERRSHLYVVPAGGGEGKQITNGPWDDSDPEWSPSGRWIAFVSNRTADPDTNDNTDIYLVRPAGLDLKRLVANPGPDDSPRWSNKGDRIAFAGRMKPNDYYQTADLMVIPAAGGEEKNLTASLDTWIASDALSVSSSILARAHWSEDDETIYATFERRGANYLAAIPSSGGPAREILGGPYVYDLVRPTPSGFVFTRTDAAHPAEIHSVAADGTGLRRLSRVNDDALSGIRLSVPDKITARNAEGGAVESWLYPPIDLDTSRSYPMIVYLHGGPQAFDGDYFDTGLENQIFPGHGYAVLRVNYRGSTSYGEAFCREIWGDWHSREYQDIMASVDEALRSRPWIDAKRLGIGGWSYGGIMTVWAVGQTNRFKVGVPERFEIDYLSCFGEDQWFAQYLEEFGSPFEKEDTYRKLSPGAYAKNIKTPLYLISDELDGNCPLPQAMQFYQRLKLLGVKTEMVIYPDEPHSMAEPDHLVDRLRRLLVWFGRHLSPPASP